MILARIFVPYILEMNFFSGGVVDRGKGGANISSSLVETLTTSHLTKISLEVNDIYTNKLSSSVFELVNWKYVCQ